jgi:hypothetical protein
MSAKYWGKDLLVDPGKLTANKGVTATCREIPAGPRFGDLYPLGADALDSSKFRLVIRFGGPVKMT